MHQLLAPPNLLTYTRLLLTPFVARQIMAGDCAGALGLVALACGTDAVDGFVARRFGWVTRLGAYLDPIADKLLLTTLFVGLGISGAAPWWLAWLVVGRDLLILGMAAIALAFTRHRDFPPSLWGKISTALQALTALALLIQCAGPELGSLTAALVWSTAVATAWSGAHYVFTAARRLWGG